MLWLVLVLVAQEGLAGNAGWAGAGLLGLVLAWLLLLHLPQKDKLVRDLVKEFRDEATAQRTTYTSEAKAERDACTKNFERIASAVERVVSK